MSPKGGGGVRKVPKKCDVLFEWPLSQYLRFNLLEKVLITFFID